MMKWIVIIPLFLWVGVAPLHAQSDTTEPVVDTTYFKSQAFGKYKPVAKVKRATHFAVDTYEGDRHVRIFAALDADGVMYRKEWENGRQSGVWRFYSEQGRLLSEYDFGKLVYGDCEKGGPVPEGVVLPVFGAGLNDLMQYLGERITYPEVSKQAGVSGTVYIHFQIDETGSPSPIKICGGGVDSFCDLVVWELIETMPKWTPGEYKGEKITTPYYLPVRFALR